EPSFTPISEIYCPVALIDLRFSMLGCNFCDLAIL
ncbi:hypothetical protein SOVF_192170, partial [Spinacia oleracea]